MTTKPFELNAADAEGVLNWLSGSAAPSTSIHPLPACPPTWPTSPVGSSSTNLGRPVAYRAATWCSYREQPTGNWYDDPQQCPVAPIFRIGIYLINDLSWFFTGVQKVQVLQSRIFTGRPTADNAQLAVLYQDGSIGNISGLVLCRRPPALPLLARAQF